MLSDLCTYTSTYAGRWKCV